MTNDITIQALQDALRTAEVKLAEELAILRRDDVKGFDRRVAQTEALHYSELIGRLRGRLAAARRCFSRYQTRRGNQS